MPESSGYISFSWRKDRRIAYVRDTFNTQLALFIVKKLKLII